MARAVVDVLEVVAVEDDEAEGAALGLSTLERVVELLLEPPTVEETRERVGVGAAPLPGERDRRIEGRRCVGSEKRRELGLLAVELGVYLAAEQGSMFSHVLAVVFFVASMFFVWRSFYGMRIGAGA